MRLNCLKIDFLPLVSGAQRCDCNATVVSSMGLNYSLLIFLFLGFNTNTQCNVKNWGKMENGVS